MDTEQQVRLKFLEEAEDCLDRIESILLGLSNAVPAPQEIDQALRAVHSVKGGAAMMGFMPLSKVAHHLEEYFKILRVRHATNPIETTVETLLLQGVDCLRQVIERHRQGSSVEESWLTAQFYSIFEQLHQHLGELRPEDEDVLLAQEEDVNPALLMFEKEVENALERLTAKLEGLSSHALAFPDIDGDLLASLREIVATVISEGENLQPTETATAAFMPAKDMPAKEQRVNLKEAEPQTALESATPKSTSDPRQTVRIPVEYLQQFNTMFGQLILERNAINLRMEQLQTFTSLLRERMQRLDLSNQQLCQWYDRASMESLIPTADRAEAEAQPTSGSSPHRTGWTTAHEQFDSLEMDRYSDLHIVSQEQIETIVQLQEVTADIDLSLQDMTQSVRELNQTTRSLQINATRTQMVPFSDAVKRFPRVIRDLSIQFGKPVKLQITGESTLIDRAILDNLSDPLLHLLRNAFDHGIEITESRIAAGKPAEGTITLQASHRGGQTVITLSDDGGGIRLDRIRTRLSELGLPKEQVARMQKSELLDFIFEPGFSTAGAVTELSGRGVGLDIVRTNLQLRGEIQVATEAGKGTTFTIRVPFTLSIIRVMLLERSGLVFAVSVDNVKEVSQLRPQQITADGSHILWNERTIPLIQLEKGITFSRPFKPFKLLGTPTIAQPTLLLTGDNHNIVGFCIDRFWGEQEVTLRSIDAPLPLPPGFNSSIILGDGRVVPLIDPVQLSAWLLAKETSEHSLTSTEEGEGDRASVAPSQRQINIILVVDDSINVRRFLALTLEKAGYQVEQARDGQEAVERLLGGLVVQAMVCDVEMPRLDGYGVLATLRAHPSFKSLPIAMLTSRSSEKHRKLAMNLGASAYFSKPYIEQELLQTLMNLIRRQAESLA